MSISLEEKFGRQVETEISTAESLVGELQALGDKTDVTKKR